MRLKIVHEGTAVLTRPQSERLTKGNVDGEEGRNGGALYLASRLECSNRVSPFGASHRQTDSTPIMLRSVHRGSRTGWPPQGRPPLPMFAPEPDQLFNHFAPSPNSVVSAVALAVVKELYSEQSATRNMFAFGQKLPRDLTRGAAVLTQNGRRRSRPPSCPPRANRRHCTLALELKRPPPDRAAKRKAPTRGWGLRLGPLIFETKLVS